MNTTTPAGKAMFGMLGIFAEYERAMIQERIRACLARAKAKGTKTGRPIGRPTVSSETEQAILHLRREGMGMGMVKIAKALGCGVSVVQRVVATA